MTSVIDLLLRELRQLDVQTVVNLLEPHLRQKLSAQNQRQLLSEIHRLRRFDEGGDDE